MARTHGADQSPTAFDAENVRPATAEGAAGPALGDAIRKTDALRVSFLGLNAWAVLVLIPTFTSNERGHYAWMALPLLALALAVLALARASTAAPACVLVLYPCALAITISAVPRLRHADAFSPVMLVFGVLSFAMYAVAGAYAMGRRSLLRKTSEHALGQRAAPAEVTKRQMLLRRGLVGAGAAFAVVAIAVAPFIGVRRTLDDAWKDASAEGAVLTTVVAGALATLVIAALIGPTLRSSKRNARKERGRATRVIPLLLLVAAGTVAYILYTQSLH